MNIAHMNLIADQLREETKEDCGGRVGVVGSSSRRKLGLGVFIPPFLLFH